VGVGWLSAAGCPAVGVSVGSLLLAELMTFASTANVAAPLSDAVVPAPAAFRLLLSASDGDGVSGRPVGDAALLAAFATAFTLGPSTETAPKLVANRGATTYPSPSPILPLAWAIPAAEPEGPNACQSS